MKAIVLFLMLPFLIIIPLAIIGLVIQFLVLRYVAPKIVKTNARAIKEGINNE